MIKHYANPVLFDLIIERDDGDKSTYTNLHGIYLIEVRDNGSTFAYLLNKDNRLTGTSPAYFNYHKYAYNSWAMHYDTPDLDALDYREGIIRIIVHPLPTNSKRARDIRIEFNDIPTKTECNL